MINEPTCEARGWRGNWFVKNVLSELPVVGGFFYTESIPKMLHHAGKSTTMLVGGGLAMMFLPSHPEEHMAVKTLKMSFGMTCGSVIFNGIYSAGKQLYECKQFTLAKKMIHTSNPPIVTLPTDNVVHTSAITDEHNVDLIKSDTVFADAVV